jgi:hypothetical protein
VNQETNATVEQPKEEKLFTQEQVNGFFNKRYAEMMSQLEEYKSKAEKFDQIEEANKTELQKATEKAEKLEAELNSMKQAETIRGIKSKVATESGVPIDLLTGTTEEECKAQADAILKFANPQSYPQLKDGGEVNNVGKPTTKQYFAEWWANQAFNK